MTSEIRRARGVTCGHESRSHFVFVRVTVGCLFTNSYQNHAITSVAATGMDGRLIAVRLDTGL